MKVDGGTRDPISPTISPRSGRRPANSPWRATVLVAGSSAGKRCPGLLNRLRRCFSRDQPRSVPAAADGRRAQRRRSSSGPPSRSPSRSPMTLAHTSATISRRTPRAASSSGSAPRSSRTSPSASRMPWSHPAARMREIDPRDARDLGLLVRTATKLDFRGEFYTHTLMTPIFTPDPTRTAPPRVVLAAVGEKMTEVAGEVADGVLVPRLHDRALPARGDAAGPRARARARRPRPRRLRDVCPAFVVTGTDEEEFEKRRRDAPADRVLRLDAGVPRRARAARLGRAAARAEPLSKQGEWEEMGDLIDDEMLETFAVVAEPSRSRRRDSRRGSATWSTG